MLSLGWRGCHGNARWVTVGAVLVVWVSDFVRISEGFMDLLLLL